jgi:hypothetical protein
MGGGVFDLLMMPKVRGAPITSRPLRRWGLPYPQGAEPRNSASHESPMDKDTQVSLHRSKVGRGDKMLKSGRFEDLYREFAAVPSSTRPEYFMMDAGRKLAPQEIDDLAKQLGIHR